MTVVCNFPELIIKVFIQAMSFDRISLFFFAIIKFTVLLCNGNGEFFLISYMFYRIKWEHGCDINYKHVSQLIICENFEY